MRTQFSAAQRADPALAAAEKIIRSCVHCGFCTATCPTYVLRGDELDSPRGRIALIQNMLESGGAPSAAAVTHIDRCLSCLGCTTTCPSGVDYHRLIDQARAHIAQHHRRPWRERLTRALIGWVLPVRARFGLALRLAAPLRGIAPWLARHAALRPLATMLSLAPRHLPRPVAARDARIAAPRGTVLLMQGCVEPVLRPEIRAATLRLLNRCGYDVLFARDEGCCGALVHHLGHSAKGREAAARNVRAWQRLDAAQPLDAILTTASGCGSMVKDYAALLAGDAELGPVAATLSARAHDISSFVATLALPPLVPRSLTIAYHAPCSLTHGLRLGDVARRALEAAGYAVRVPAEAHLCCGSAGSYAILQSEMANALGDRKAAALAALDADVIATGNIGCATHLAARSGLPLVHSIELLDWATGGPTPPALAGRGWGD